VRQFFKNPSAIILIVIMAAMSILNGRFSNPGDWFFNTLLIIPGVFIGLAFHEFAHAGVASLLGDSTPKLQGRVTINPFAHIDPVGLIALVFIGFGWGKAVQINPENFSHTRRDSFFVSIAGIVMNFILAFIFTGLLKVLRDQLFLTSDMGNIAFTIVWNVILINLVLMVFNLLPVPPLDGFNIVTEIFDLRHKKIWYRIYDLGFPILMALIIFGVTGRILEPAVNTIFNFIYWVWFSVL
jgi:Zn-dependent protease